MLLLSPALSRLPNFLYHLDRLLVGRDECPQSVLDVLAECAY